MTYPKRKRPHKASSSLFSEAWRTLGFHLSGVLTMSFDLILPFLRPIEPLLLDDSIGEVMGNPDASSWYERNGIVHRDASVSFDAGRLRTGHSEPEWERWTASATHVFRDTAKNNQLAVNPLGVTIVRFRADQAFS